MATYYTDLLYAYAHIRTYRTRQKTKTIVNIIIFHPLRQGYLEHMATKKALQRYSDTPSQSRKTFQGGRAKILVHINENISGKL